MASIEKRGKNSWRLVVEAGYDENNKRVKKTKTVKVEDETILRAPKRLREHLELELAKFKMEVEAQEYIKPEKMKLEAFFTVWKAHYGEDPDNLSPTTYRTYCFHMDNHILPRFGNTYLDEIKTMKIVEFFKKLKDPGSRKDGKGTLAAGTVQVVYRAFKNVLTRAVEWKLLQSNPMDGVKKPTVEKKEMEYYDENEALEVIQALYKEPDVWRLYCLGALIGGFRRGELTALEWSNVNFHASTIRVEKNIPLTRKGVPLVKKPKSKSSIDDVDMPSWYMEEMLEYHESWQRNKENMSDKWLGGDNEYVFHAGFGKPFYYSYPSEWWSDFLKRHELKPVRFHDLRHSTATLLLEAGESMKSIQKRLRHAQQSTTADIYTHVTKKIKQATAEKFNKFDPKRKSVPNPSPSTENEAIEEPIEK